MSAILVGEGWISEHYFGTEATRESFHARVLERRRSWDARTGLTPRGRFAADRAALEADLARLAESDGPATAIHQRILGFLEVREHGHDIRADGPLLRVSAPGSTGGAPLIVLLAAPAATIEDVLAKDGRTLAEPYRPRPDGDELTSAARLVSALFAADDAPELILILAGRWAVLTEPERWAEGRWLAVDLQLVCERNDTRRGGEIDRMLTCLSAESIAPDGAGGLWWRGVLDESIRHTAGVSRELRDGVRKSIEILAGEVVRRRCDLGLAPLPAAEAQPLAKQALRYLYRILFLLYAEASPELGVLPVTAPGYDHGYGLDRLRELIQVELATPRDRAGRHLYESLGVLFRLVDQGHRPRGEDGLTFHPLRADLFQPGATAHLDAVGLGNAALQEVLAHLLLSPEKRGRDRGFLSYAELGLNQLGAVYEGLMSYTGSFGPTGAFEFRPSGRERRQSASYYTPEVLTRFTVGQALDELLDQDGRRTTAAEILTLTICEPALGSGAFAIEAVRQLAEQYLRRRQDELGRRIDPDDHPRRLQEVKAYLALHNVYGVDLNATAVELAEISLWLDTMVEGLSAPWLGLHLRRGNSLIGARRAVHHRDRVADRSWAAAAPREVPLTEPIGPDDIHHFLLPADGWGAAADATEAAALAPDAARALRRWRNRTRARPTAQTLLGYGVLARRVERLWQLAHRRLALAEEQIRRSIPVWEAGALPAGGQVRREEIERALADEDGPYRRLRRVMDAWTALWFWPLTTAPATVDGELIAPPTVTQWIAGLQALLNPASEDPVPASMATWDELDEADRRAAGRPITEIRREHPWLVVCERIAEREGFFHWSLDFATVFARGGFDLQVGNPPWVRPRSDTAALLAEGDPWWLSPARSSQAEIAARRAETLARPGMTDLVVDGITEVLSTAAFVGSAAQYPHLRGLQPDLYRCFIEIAWRHASPGGISALIHLESHFTDENAQPLRTAMYRRLRRHWHFQNKLMLFDIKDEKQFGITVSGRPREPRFLQACWLYHPDTVLRSLEHDGSGPEPGMKDEAGHWDLRPHRARITTVTSETLRTWHSVLDSDDQDFSGTRMVYTVNRAAASALGKLVRARRVSSMGPLFSRGWDESVDRRNGLLESGWSAPADWSGVILQGPHVYVANPFYKTPNATLRSNQDWSPVDLERLAAEAIPATAFYPAGAAYDRAYTHWDGRPARDSYRLAWRKMAAGTGERTLAAALIPPRSAHIHGLFSVGVADEFTLALLAGFLSSLVLDFAVRASPKANIGPAVIGRLPVVADHPLRDRLVLRALRLNCLTEAYADLWARCFRGSFTDDDRLGDVGPEWTTATPLRLAADRRRALVEIDALVALMLGWSADELCTVYRTQFAVLHGYDRNTYLYDAAGRLVPTSVLTAWRRHGDRISAADRTATTAAGHTYRYELPFVTLDREADMRRAHAYFGQTLR